MNNLILIDDNKEKIKEVIDFIKIDTNIVEFFYWGILEDKFNFVFEREAILEKFKEKEGGLLCLTAVINKAIALNIDKTDINFLIKSLGSKYVQTEQEKIECLNSNVEPFFNAIKAAVFVYKKIEKQLDFETIYLNKEIVGYSLKEILIQKNQVKELTEKLGKEEIYETFKKNVLYIENLIFSVMQNIENIDISNVQNNNTNININYQKIFEKIDQNTQKVLSEIQSLLNVPDKENNENSEDKNLKFNEAFLIQNIKDALKANRENLNKQIIAILDEKIEQLNSFIKKMNETEKTFKENAEFFKEKSEYIDNTNIALSGIKEITSESNGILKQIEEVVNKLYEDYKNDMKEAKTKYEAVVKK